MYWLFGIRPNKKNSLFKGQCLKRKIGKSQTGRKNPEKLIVNVTVTRCKVSIQESIMFLYISNKQLENKFKK